MFACFCLHYAGIEEKNFPYASNCQRWINQLKKAGLYAPRNSYTPKVGDLAFFDWQNDNDSDHVGIIFALDYNDDGEVKGVRTIEGNSKGAAVYDGKYYGINDGTMIGFGLVNKAYDHQLEKLPRDVSAEYAGYTVSAHVEPSAKIPVHAELDVREILPGDDGYDRMLSDLRGALAGSALAYARFMKIGFVDEDGARVEAQTPVGLTVTFNEKLTGGKDLMTGAAVMTEPVALTGATFENDKHACTFSFTQDVSAPVCLYAAGTLEYKEGTLKAKQGKQSVSVNYTAEAMVPDGATLEFYEIEPDSDAYAACLATLGGTLGGADVRFYAVNVSLNGVPVRPAVPVAVTLDGNHKGAAAELVRVKDGAELVCQATPRKGKLVIDFNADRFGTFAVVYSD